MPDTIFWTHCTNSETPLLSSAKPFPCDCPLEAPGRIFKDQWHLLRHLPGCLIRYRTQFPQVPFNALYNLFVPLLKTSSVKPTHVLDVLRTDFLEDINRLGYDKLLGQTYYTERWIKWKILKNWKTFSWRSQLKVKNINFSTRWTCNVDPDCTYRTLEATDMRRHKQNHVSAKSLQIKMFSCTKCKHSFRSKSNLRQHLNRKTSCVQETDSETNTSESTDSESTASEK